MPVPVPRQRDTSATESGQAVLHTAAPAVAATGVAQATPQTTAPHTTPLTLLVIEDDPAGGLTVPEILDADGHRIRLRTARNLTEAERLLTPDVHCILLDLSLPDASARTPGATANGSVNGAAGTVNGTGTATAVDQLLALRQVLRIAPRHAVLVLTGEDDVERAAEAVRVGAQDFLFRDELDGRLLSRAIRYAVEKTGGHRPVQARRIETARPGERPAGARSAPHAPPGGLRPPLRRPLPPRPQPGPARR